MTVPLILRLDISGCSWIRRKRVHTRDGRLDDRRNASRSRRALAASGPFGDHRHRSSPSSTARDRLQAQRAAQQATTLFGATNLCLYCGGEFARPIDARPCRAPSQGGRDMVSNVVPARPKRGADAPEQARMRCWRAVRAEPAGCLSIVAPRRPDGVLKSQFKRPYRLRRHLKRLVLALLIGSTACPCRRR